MCRTWLDPVEMVRILTALLFMAILVFQVLKGLVVHGRASSIGGNVASWSQAAPCITVVDSESVCSWFDLV